MGVPCGRTRRIRGHVRRHRNGAPIMSTATETANTATEKAAGDGEQQEQTFTQAEVDRIVKERAERIAKQRYPDYDELKAKAEGSKTLEERIGGLEAELATSKAEALRARVAAEFGISTKRGPKGEPSDADLFLTGVDEETLTRQANRLAEREADRKKHGNVAPKEGDTTTTGKNDSDMREFAKELFARAD